MAPKKKDAWMDDGDSAHWVKSKRGRKKINAKEGSKAGAGASGRTEKYLGKRKTTRKRVAGK